MPQNQTRADRYTGSQKMPVYYSDFMDNFTVHPASDALAVITNANSVRQAIKNLVYTNLGERPFEPLVGTNMSATLFEMNDFITVDTLTTNITYAINTYEKRANLVSVQVTPSTDQSALLITIVFTILNNPTQETINLILKRAR